MKPRIKSGFSTLYFALCLVPWAILAVCYRLAEYPLLALLDGRALFGGLLVELLSALLGAVGLVAATLAPRGLRSGILIAAAVAAIPGMWILTG